MHCIYIICVLKHQILIYFFRLNQLVALNNHSLIFKLQKYVDQILMNAPLTSFRNIQLKLKKKSFEKYYSPVKWKVSFDQVILKAGMK